MPYPLPLTRTEAYLAYKAGVVQLSDLKPSLAKPRIGIDDWLAYWTGLKNDYPKNPDGTPKMLQEEEKYIAYLSGVTNTYPEKCLRRVGAYLRYLISARWGRPDHPLNREELYLSLIKTQFIPSGDPSSDITIEGTCKAPFVDVKMYGDAFQQSYTGKNLAQPLDKYTYSLNVGATIESQSDGTVVFKTSSSSTSSGLFIYKTTGNNATLCPELFTAGYTVSFDVMATDTCTFEFGVTGKHATSTISTTKQRVSAATATGAGMVFYNNSRNGATITISNIQVEAGSTSTSFEPFVGGQPSPNPSYPQDINVVTGTQTISINGTNYPISLGSLELCKIGNYQDYIYKDGDDWKVHKATVSAIIDGSESWDTSGTNTFYVANIYSKIGNSIQSASTGEMYASHFTIADITSSNTLVGASLKVDAAHNVSNLRIRLQDMSGGTAGFRQMLSAKKPSIYARRLTPTDTTITDTNLIAQLDALVNGGAEDGTTYIKVNATDPNLPGLLYVEAPKYE